MQSESQLIENGVSTLDLGFLVKKSEVDGLKNRNCREIKCKRNT